MRALRAARDVEPRDWLMNAAAIRDVVFDARERAPDLPWEAKNQAVVHRC